MTSDKSDSAVGIVWKTTGVRGVDAARRVLRRSHWGHLRRPLSKRFNRSNRAFTGESARQACWSQYAPYKTKRATP